MVILDRIRLTGLLTKSPAQVGLFYTERLSCVDRLTHLPLPVIVSPERCSTMPNNVPGRWRPGHSGATRGPSCGAKEVVAGGTFPSPTPRRRSHRHGAARLHRRR